MTLSRRTLVTGTNAALCATSALGQTAYPTRLIELPIGFAPGIKGE